MSEKPDLSELLSFDKDTLKKREINEKNSLPNKAVMEEEKRRSKDSANAE